MLELTNADWSLGSRPAVRSVYGIVAAAHPLAANAGAEMLQQEAEYQLTRLDVLAETSRRYYQLLALQAKISVNNQRQVEEAAALKSIQQRARAGAIGQADVAKMALRQARTQDQGRRLQNAQALAKLRLAAMWQGDGNFTKAHGNLNQLPTLYIQ